MFGSIPRLPFFKNPFFLATATSVYILEIFSLAYLLEVALISLSLSFSLYLLPFISLSLFQSPLLGIKFKIYFHLKLFCLKMDCKPPEICTLYIVQHIHTNCHTYDSMYINEYLLGKTLRQFFSFFGVPDPLRCPTGKIFRLDISPDIDFDSSNISVDPLELK